MAVDLDSSDKVLFVSVLIWYAVIWQTGLHPSPIYVYWSGSLLGCRQALSYPNINADIFSIYIKSDKSGSVFHL